jgi:hypothetical protein
MGNSFFPNVTLTDDIYWLAQPTAIRALRQMPSGPERDEKALALAQAGYIVDVPIMVWNWDAVSTMGVRQQLGFAWVPSAFQAPLSGMPGTSLPIPPGAIKVSTNAADYPPFDPPAPPQIPATNVIGWQVFGKVYTFGPGALANGKPMVTDGQVVTQDGIQYSAHVTTGSLLGMGVTIYFERITPPA